MFEENFMTFGTSFPSRARPQPQPQNQPREIFLPNTPLAMAYVPMQKWETPYEPEVGFDRGTIFPGLDKPYIGEEISDG